MAKIKMEVKHLKDIDGGSIIAMLEERSVRIRELEAESLGHKSMSDQYRGWWEAQREQSMALEKKITALTEKLALCDGTADRRRIDIVEAALQVRDGEIATLRDDLARCLGWIDCQLDHHPLPDHSSKRSIGGAERVLARAGTDPGPQPHPDAWWDGSKWRRG